MGTHADLTRPVDAEGRGPRIPWWEQTHASPVWPQRRELGLPLLGQTVAMMRTEEPNVYSTVWIITVESKADEVYLAAELCPKHGCHDVYVEWDGSTEDWHGEPFPVVEFIGEEV